MHRYNGILCLLITLELCAVNPVGVQATRDRQQGSGISQLVGNWSGESICVNKEKFPACHDEQVVYRIVQRPSKSNTLTVTMDKIVSGKPENMAVLDFVYEPQKKTLSSEFTRNGRHGIWEFVVKDDLMDGTLTTLPDKTLVRRIKVKKDK